MRAFANRLPADVENILINQTSGRAAALLPKISVSDRHLRDVTTDSLNALRQSNRPPHIFTMGTGIVRVLSRDDGRHVVEYMSEAAMRGVLARSANYTRPSKTQARHRAVSPPGDVVKDILSLPSDQLELPPLGAIVEAPVLLPDGRVLSNLGYDPASKLYYAPPAGFQTPEVADLYHRDDARAAAEFIEGELLSDFPFVDGASRSNAMAALVTPVLRHSIAGPVPMAVIDAVTRGTGKSLYSDLISIVATGHPADARGLEGSEEEVRKIITSLLMSNPAGLVFFDNVTGVLKSSALERALTCENWGDRVLGESRDVELHVRASWFCTGNNVRISGDLPRRVYWIRMDAECSQPYLRTGFRHKHIINWAINNRAPLIQAILVMARAWWCAGQPPPAVSPLGKYEQWTRVVGGLLEFAGCSEFLGNFRQGVDEMDSEFLDWAYFLAALHEKYECRDTDAYLNGFTAPELFQQLSDSSAHSEQLRLLIPEAAADCLRHKETGAKSLGKVLKFRSERRFAMTSDGIETEYWLSPASTKRPIRWRVRRREIRPFVTVGTVATECSAPTV
jgi:hypothetical protein